jgi:hypothetical protein
MFLSSKTPYWPQQMGDREEMPAHCKLAHVNHVGRHGSRHATKLKAPKRLGSTLREAAALNQLTPLGHEVLNWVADFYRDEFVHLGELTPAGRMEHAGTAARVWQRHAETFADALADDRPMVFEATDKSRTRGSRDAFLGAVRNASLLAGLARAPLRVPEPPQCPVPGGDYLSFSKLRFFESCRAYVEYKDAKPWTMRLARFTANATRVTSHESTLLRQVFTPDFVAVLADAEASNQDRQRRKAARAAVTDADDDDVKAGIFDMRSRTLSPLASRAAQKSVSVSPPPQPSSSRKTRKLSAKVARLQKRLEEMRKDEEKDDDVKRSKLPGITELVFDIYDICIIEQDALGRADRLCSLFAGPHIETMAKYELLSDAADYWKQGSGDPIAYAASCTLLEDFFEAGDRGAARNRPGAPVANFRFGHSETIMPFLSMLGLWQEPGSVTPEDHYTEELSRGTSHLLNATRERLASVFYLAESYDSNAAGDTAPFSESGLARPQTATAVSARRAENAVAWPLGASQSLARPVPKGFSEPLLLALKHPWAGARIAPMAANVQWELYDCGEGDDSAMRGLWVMMMHNERLVPFPACNAGSEAGAQWVEPSGNAAAGQFGMRFPCPWKTVKSYYQDYVYNNIGVGTCDADVFEAMCGGISAECETDDALRLRFS